MGKQAGDCLVRHLPCNGYLRLQTQVGDKTFREIVVFVVTRQSVSDDNILQSAGSSSFAKCRHADEVLVALNLKEFADCHHDLLVRFNKRRSGVFGCRIEQSGIRARIVHYAYLGARNSCMHLNGVRYTNNRTGKHRAPKPKRQPARAGFDDPPHVDDDPGAGKGRARIKRSVYDIGEMDNRESLRFQIQKRSNKRNRQFQAKAKKKRASLEGAGANKRYNRHNDPRGRKPVGQLALFGTDRMNFISGFLRIVFGERIGADRHACVERGDGREEAYLHIRIAWGSAAFVICRDSHWSSCLKNIHFRGQPSCSAARQS